jgi:hypothetical protein
VKEKGIKKKKEEEAKALGGIGLNSLFAPKDVAGRIPSV